MKFRRSNRTKLNTNLIPLIDVIFVILIFFLVLFRFSSFDVDENENEETGKFTNKLSKTLELEKTIFIEMNQDGKIFVDLKAVSISDLARIIKAKNTNPKDISCLLIVDRDATYELFSPLFLRLKELGIIKISLIK